VNAFQVLGLSLLALFTAVTLAAVLRNELSRGPAAAWIMLWLAAATAIAWPEITIIVAHAMGIQRGADLVFYGAVLATFAGFFIVFARLRRIDRALTRIVREIAIRDTRSPEP
jgi:hypothetical protein